MPSYAMDSEKVKEKSKQTAGVISGIVASPPIGFCRGFTGGLLQGSKSTAAAFGNEDVITYRVIGGLTYGLIKGSAGAVVGIFKGLRDGIHYGKESPFSKESYSLSGNNFFDYDSFKWD